jgi:5-methylcytosine-specific restriction endonuclease McrA
MLKGSKHSEESKKYLREVAIKRERAKHERQKGATKKYCSKCKTVKNVLEFWRNKKDRLYCHCKKCQRQTTTNWEKRNISRVKEMKKRFLKRHPEAIEKARLRNKARRLKIRFLILKKYDFTCQYCGRKAPQVILQIDHVIPKSRGGKNSTDNYKIACKDCNIGKGDVLLEEFL